MKLSEIGEFGFIERFAHRFEDLLAPSSMGIGDDCAVLPANEEYDLVFTTDMLVEDIHFLRDKISPLDLGYKALAVNLSDVAAMGAQPIGSFLSIAIPQSIEVEYLDALIEGYHQLSEFYHLPLMGGDTTRSPYKLVINISVIGRVAKGKAKLRTAAQVGDIIVVTGKLGNSAAGLQIITQNLPIDEHAHHLIDCHNRPSAHVEEGIWLGNQAGVNAMMDVSDGIASDLGHILKASAKGAEIHLEKLPISNDLKQYCSTNNLDVTELATSGGEDYCLLLTIDPVQFDNIAAKFKELFNKELYPLGNITQGENINYTLNGISVQGLRGGFNHFI